MDKIEKSTELVNTMRKLIFQVRSLSELITEDGTKIDRLKVENKHLEELAKSNAEVRRLRDLQNKNNIEIKKIENRIKMSQDERERYINQESTMNDDLNEIAAVDGEIQVKLTKLDDFFQL